MAPRKKSNRKEIYDIATGNRIELPEDDRRSEMAAAILTGNGLAIEEDPEVEKELDGGFMDALRKLTDGAVDMEKLENDRIGRALRNDPKLNAEDIMEREYPELVRYPDPTGFLKAILTELIMQRRWR